ncbi:MAG: host attachment protein [Polyangiaceae bacterium]|nr:host attachment protein [Polyangiaceae bacterium]
MDKPRKTFVLVADASRARLYEKPDSTSKLVLLEEFEHPEARAKNLDLMADKPGRRSAPAGTGPGRSAQEYRTEPKEVEAEKFARELAQRIADHFDAHVFDDLVIAAPPKFLGLLRATLGTHHDHVYDRVVAWHEKDYTTVTDVKELSERLSLAA